MMNVNAFKWYLPFVTTVNQNCYQSCCLSGNALYSVSPVRFGTGEIQTNHASTVYSVI
jgi:hypothetical protein